MDPTFAQLFEAALEEERELYPHVADLEGVDREQAIVRLRFRAAIRASYRAAVASGMKVHTQGRDPDDDLEAFVRSIDADWPVTFEMTDAAFDAAVMNGGTPVRSI